MCGCCLKELPVPEVMYNDGSKVILQLESEKGEKTILLLSGVESSTTGNSAKIQAVEFAGNSTGNNDKVV